MDSHSTDTRETPFGRAAQAMIDAERAHRAGRLSDAGLAEAEETYREARIAQAKQAAPNTASEPMHLLVADAHHAILDGSDSAAPIIDSMIARLTRAKAAHEAGDKITASREMDPAYVVKARA